MKTVFNVHGNGLLCAMIAFLAFMIIFLAIWGSENNFTYSLDAGFLQTTFVALVVILLIAVLRCPSTNARSEHLILIKWIAGSLVLVGILITPNVMVTVPTKAMVFDPQASEQHNNHRFMAGIYNGSINEWQRCHPTWDWNSSTRTKTLLCTARAHHGHPASEILIELNFDPFRPRVFRTYAKVQETGNVEVS